MFQTLFAAGVARLLVRFPHPTSGQPFFEGLPANSCTSGQLATILSVFTGPGCDPALDDDGERDRTDAAGARSCDSLQGKDDFLVSGAPTLS